MAGATVGANVHVGVATAGATVLYTYGARVVRTGAIVGWAQGSAAWVMTVAMAIETMIDESI